MFLACDSCLGCFVSHSVLHVVDVVLAELPVLCPEMANEGTLWFSNLLTPDTSLALPVAVCLLNIIIIQVCFIICMSAIFALSGAF